MIEDKDVKDANENDAEKNELWSNTQDEPDAELERIAHEMDTPAKKFARWPENRRTLFERVAGLALGVLSGSALTFIKSDSGSFLSLGVVVALVLAMIVPRILENKLQTRMKLLRKYLIVALGAYIVIMLVITLTSGASLLAS